MFFNISIAGFFTIFIFALFPALGPYDFFDYVPYDYLLKSLNHLCQLRQNILDIRNEDGIIVFPSFHSVIALICIYTFINDKKSIFIFVLSLNSLMIFSCLSHGEHYLTDVIAGFGVFIITIGSESLVFKGIKKYGAVGSIKEREAFSKTQTYDLN